MTITIFPAPGAPDATQITESFSYFTVPADTGILSTFDTTDIEVSEPLYISRYNISYNVVQNYLFEHKPIKQTVITPVNYQKLIFDNTKNNTVLFKVGYKIKITVPDTGYSTIVTLTRATSSSITFLIPNGFPTTGVNGLRLVNVTSDVYPKDLVYLKNIQQPSSSFVNISSPNVNLFVAEMSPNPRGVKISDNITVSSALSLDTPRKLETYINTPLFGDVKLQITSQSGNIASNTSNIVRWLTRYEYENVLKFSSIIKATTKTIYFDTQSTIPFPTGSTIRITDASIPFVGTYTVALGTSSSVLINSCPVFNINEAYIDNLTITVKSVSNITPSYPPLTSLENYFFSRIKKLGAVPIAAANQSDVLPKSGTLQLAISKLGASELPLNTGKVNTANVVYTVTAVDSRITSKELASQTVSSSIVWSNQFTVLASNDNTYTVPSIAQWYTFDGRYNKFVSIKSTSQYITLYTASSIINIAGEFVRITHATVNYDATFAISSYTVNSVTFKKPVNLPIVLGMYVSIGTTSYTTDVTYSNNNSIPLLNKMSANIAVTIEQPLVTTIFKGAQTRPVASPINIINSKEYASTVSIPATSWSLVKVYITSVSGYATVPSIPRWYTLDGLINTLAVVKPVSSTITLFTSAPQYGLNTGNKLKITFANIGDMIYDIISSTLTSVTIDCPKLPSDATLYCVFGYSGFTTSTSYTNTNTVPFVSKSSAVVSISVNNPMLTLLNNPVEKFIADTTKLTTDTLKPSFQYYVADITVKPSRSVASVTPTVTTAWSSVLVVQSRSGFTAAVPTIPQWYTFDGKYNLFKITKLNLQTVTLFVPTNTLTGTVVRVVDPTARFDRTFNIVALTPNSVTFIEPSDFPISIYNMYVYYGSTTISSAVSYTVDNSISLVNVIKPTIVESIDLRSVSKLVNYSAYIRGKTVQPPYEKAASREVASVTSTPTFAWSSVKVYVNGISNLTTSPSIATWYIQDGKYNKFNVLNLNTSSITLFTVPSPYSNVGTKLKIVYDRRSELIFDILSYTNTSVTISIDNSFTYDLISYITFGNVSTSTAVTYTVDNSVSIVKHLKTTFVGVPVTSQTSNINKPMEKFVADTTTLTTDALKDTFRYYVTGITASASKEVAVTTAKSVITWSDQLVVLSKLDVITSPTIQTWYIFDSRYNYVNSATLSYITLYTATSDPAGTKVRVIQPPSRFDQTFDIISKTKNSVTFIRPSNFPMVISNMFISYGMQNTQYDVTYQTDNTVPQIVKISIPINDVTPNWLTTLKFNMQYYPTGDTAKIQQSRLETYDNQGYTVDTPITITQTIENVIPIDGRSSLYTTNIKNWIIFDGRYNTLVRTAVAPSNNTVLYFSSATAVTFSSKVSIGNYATNTFQQFSVVSSSANSVTVNDNGILGACSGLYIYVNTTFMFTQLKYIPAVVGVVTLTNNNTQYKPVVSVVSGTSLSITVVKPNATDTFDTFTISPSISPRWKIANTPFSAKDSLYKSLVLPRPLAATYANNLKNDTTLIKSAVIERPTLTVVGDSSKPVATVKSITTTPSTTWYDAQTVYSRSGLAFSISTATSYTFDGLYNLFKTVVIPAPYITLTLYNNAKFISGNLVRVVSNRYDRIFTVVSSTINTVTFLDPKDFPISVADMYITFGQSTTIETVTYTDTNLIPQVTNVRSSVSNDITVGITQRVETLYYQNDVRTILPPINARENLYYLLVLPYKRAEPKIPEPLTYVVASLTVPKFNNLVVRETEVFDAPKNNNVNGFKIPVTNSVNEVKLPDTMFNINNFYNVPNDIKYALEQTKYNVVNWYIKELPLLSRLGTSGSYTTLTFINLEIRRVFAPGDTVRISLNTFSTAVTVLSSTINSIVFASVVNFPALTNGMVIQNYTYPVYPNTQTYLDIVGRGMPLNNTLPRENYASLDIKPNVRGATSFTGTLFNDALPLLYDQGNLTNFTDPKLPSATSLQITSQVLLQTVEYNSSTVNWYIYDQQQLTYSTLTIRTYYFAVQQAVPFAIGSQIKISTAPKSLFTVYNCTVNSISIINPSFTISISSAFVQSVGNTVYPQLLVSTNVAPVTPRENLYRMMIAPLSITRVTAIADTATITVDKIRSPANLAVAGPNTTDTRGKVNKLIIKEFEGGMFVPKSNTLNKPLFKIAGVAIAINSSTINKPTERFVSADKIETISGKVNRLKVTEFEGGMFVPKSNTLNKPLFKIAGVAIAINSSTINKPTERFVSADITIKSGNVNKPLFKIKAVDGNLKVSIVRMPAPRVAESKSMFASEGQVSKFTVNRIAAIRNTDIIKIGVETKGPIQFWN